MIEGQTFVIGPATRREAVEAVSAVPAGWLVHLRPPMMNSGQRKRLNAICSDIAKSGTRWGGASRKPSEWRLLLVSAHATATAGENFGEFAAEVIYGLEGELVNLRETTAEMSRARGASLIEYATAWAVMRGIALNDGKTNHHRRTK